MCWEFLTSRSLGSDSKTAITVVSFWALVHAGSLQYVEWHHSRMMKQCKLDTKKAFISFQTKFATSNACDVKLLEWSISTDLEETG